MDYVVLETGGKQFKVNPGDIINIEKIDKKKGETITFDKILLYLKNNEYIMGNPYIENKTVPGEVLSQFKAKKILGFKYKAKKRYRKRYGHRQQYTRVKIGEI